MNEESDDQLVRRRHKVFQSRTEQTFKRLCDQLERYLPHETANESHLLSDIRMSLRELDDLLFPPEYPLLKRFES